MQAHLGHHALCLQSLALEACLHLVELGLAPDELVSLLDLQRLHLVDTGEQRIYLPLLGKSDSLL